MSRKIVNLVRIFWIVIIMFFVCTTAFASTEGSVSDLLIKSANGGGKVGSSLVEQFNGDNTTGTESGVNIIQKIIGPILNIVRIVATGISVIMITYLGIKYMSAAPSEKANIKNMLITFTIGAVVVIGAATLLEIIRDFAEQTTIISG